MSKLDSNYIAPKREGKEWAELHYAYIPEPRAGS
jgi:hypothetical protein